MSHSRSGTCQGIAPARPFGARGHCTRVSKVGCSARRRAHASSAPAADRAMLVDAPRRIWVPYSSASSVAGSGATHCRTSWWKTHCSSAMWRRRIRSSSAAWVGDSSGVCNRRFSYASTTCTRRTGSSCGVAGVCNASSDGKDWMPAQLACASRYAARAAFSSRIGVAAGSGSDTNAGAGTRAQAAITRSHRSATRATRPS